MRSTEARKARSEARLRAAKIATNEHLPILDPPPLSRARGVMAIRRRCLVSSAVQAVPNGRDRRDVVRWLRALLDAMSWRAEALWTSWWALGYVQALSFPPRSCDLGDVLDREGVDVPWIGMPTRAFVRSGRHRRTAVVSLYTA